MTMQRAWPASGLVVILLVGGLTGCSGGKSNVTGKVTYKTVPVSGGTIKLVFDSKEFFGIISADGSYGVQVEGVSGLAQVAIETESTPRSGGGKGLAPGVANVDGAKGSAPVYMKIPSKYADPRESGLTVEVKQAAVSKNFDLSD